MTGHSLYVQVDGEANPTTDPVPMTRRQLFRWAGEQDKKYRERLDEKIICGQCGHHFSKYLTICPECMYGLGKVRKTRPCDYCLCGC